MSANPNTPRVTNGLRYTPLAALIATLIYACTEQFLSSAFAEVFAVGSIAFGAAFAVGALSGFLFGIPRRLQKDDDTVGDAVLTVNTNLEQISDWLTKIIVGVGLVQLGQISSGLQEVASSMVIGDKATAQTFALALLIYGLLDGFLVGYVWTRVELSSQLALADALLQPIPAPPAGPPTPPPLMISAPDADTLA